MLRHTLTHSPLARARRGGAVIIVVLALLSLMIFLGIFFFEFVQEEQLASVNYVTNPYDGAVNPDKYLDEAERQLIVGPDASKPESVLAAGIPGEDLDLDGNLDVSEDLNGNHILDPGEDANSNGVLDLAEDQNNNGFLDAEDSFTTTPPVGIADGNTGTPQSLIAHLVGRVQPNRLGMRPTDVVPHNGHGIKTIVGVDSNDDGIIDGTDVYDVDGDGVIAPWNDVNGDGNFDYASAMGPDYEGDCVLFDLDGDNIPDASLYPLDSAEFSTLSTLPLFGINYSRPAQLVPNYDAFAQAPVNALRPFQPDVDYTYPDINNLFLAHDTIDPVTGFRILVPSFHRPDLFPAMRSTNFGGLYTSTNTRRLVMRPHWEHVYPDATPADRTDNISRFLTDPAGTQAQSGDLNRLIQPFPFTVDADGDGIVNEMGIYSNTTTNVGYDLDVDLNGDGQPDGIWMDLGLDLVDLPDGRQFVPLFSFYILDADSLINANAHGNLQGLIENGVAFDSGAPYSVSNTGASASEVNPLRVLTGNPDAFLFGSAERNFALAELIYAYATLNPAASIAALTTANIELEFILAGRQQSRSGSSLGGRYGEPHLISSGAPRGAGITGVDDDDDNTPAGSRYQGGGQQYKTLYDPRGSATGAFADVTIPYASHPIAPKGTGNSAYQITGVTAGQRTIAAAATGSPVVWPQYSSGWEAPQSDTIPAGSALTSRSPYPYTVAPVGNTLFPSGTTSMLDEDDEIRLQNPDRVYDDIYRPEDNLGFQVSDTDRQRLGVVSRPEQIAPFNWKTARTAADIRRLFTTDSWDLTELTYVPGRFSAGVGRTETSEWGTTGRWFYPPAFGTTLFSNQDPIRPEVRALLACEDTNFVPGNNTQSSRRESFNFGSLMGYTTNSMPAYIPLWRQPLNLNKLLVGFDPSGGYPILRDLMPHPDIVAMEYQDTGASIGTLTIPAMIHDHDAVVPAAVELPNIIASPASDAQRAQTATAMEWWARYDRQRMARDIYTLLYLVGAPPGTNPAVDPAATVYPNVETVREMAQFAVNYVDSLDRDDVITRFEYDDDLSNGWAGPYKLVYGIERASLTFSEVQFFQTNPQANITRTLPNEVNDVHQFLHMELRNSSPFTVDLGEGWRISRVVRNATGGTGIRDRTVEFRTKGFGTGAALVKQVAPGSNFLIGTHDGTVTNGAGAPACSDLYADVTGGAQLESILPSSAATIPNDSTDPDPQTDLDLAVIGRAAPFDHENYIAYINGTSGYTGTRLVEMIPMGTPAPVKFDLVLERRQNLNGVELAANISTSSSMGEWIEVDRFEVDSDAMDSLQPTAALNPAGDTQAAVELAIRTLNSVERRQSFDPVQVSHTNAAAPGYSHTMSATAATKHIANEALGTIGLTQFTLWQPHFDRDFTSVYELLSVPLYGNWPLTELVSGLQTGTTASTPAGPLTPDTFYKEIHGGTQFNLAPGSTTAASGKVRGDFTAGIRFHFPNGIPGRPYQGWNQFNYQNAWYRLFDFVTVPRRADQQSEEIVGTVAGATKPVQRVPGKINLNTLRDENVLAALIDDETHLSYGSGAYDNVTLTSGSSAYRNWYRELMRSRDGVDYFADSAGTPRLAIPNSIVSQPFRGNSAIDPLAYSNAMNSYDRGVENGMLRTTGLRHDDFDGDADSYFDRPPGLGTAYSSPTLTSPLNFSGTGLWPGAAPRDTSGVAWQSLFDAGDLANTDIDHHTRSRILAKIANNSTNKSHVFFVWTAVGYFEAHRESVSGNGRVQIGARLTDIPIHRRFSVVDMSRLDDGYDAANNSFDAKKFVIYQKRLK